MTGDAQGYFKNHVRAPEEVYLSTGISTAPPLPSHGGLPYSTSWPTGSSSYMYTSTGPHFSMKTENSPALSVPSVLPRDVDASKYERLSYDEWYTGRTEYDSSSPSSSGYYPSSPATPNEGFSDDWLNLLLPANYFIHGETSTTGSASHSTASMPYTTMSMPTSNPFQPSYTAPSGLPTVHGLMGSTSIGHPTYAQFHHHSMIEPSLSPPGLEAQTPSESDFDDTEDTPGSDSSPQTPYYAVMLDGDTSRELQDEILVQMRQEDYSYREIKRLCGFKEAESTLRGRHRALTKDRAERVRKPQWKTHDITLLRQAVRHYNNNSKTKMRCGRRKLPWKKISQRMKDHGSSYLFAPATCAKKWESLGN